MSNDEMIDRLAEFCPNCGRPHNGLYSSSTRILHCGCYWDADNDDAVYTFATDPEMNAGRNEYLDD